MDRRSVGKVGSGAGEVVVYEAQDGTARVDVRLEGENLWLSLAQIADLFGRDKSVISRHLRNVLESGELDREAVVAKNATTAADGKTYQVEFYNLDAILSVGYRVNSKQGTRFRIWATRTLRDHLLRGYTLNERRLAERGLGDIEQALSLLSRTLSAHGLITGQGRAVLDVVRSYARSWRLLLQYDEDRLPVPSGRPAATAERLERDQVAGAVATLRGELAARGEAGPLFGQERGEALAGILGAIEQTFGGEPLYPSAGQRAAHLLYFVIKDHPFADGNKRIGCLLFLEYLRRHGLLARADGSPQIPDTTLVALALLLAESDASHKDIMIRLVHNLIGEEPR